MTDPRSAFAALRNSPRATGMIALAGAYLILVVALMWWWSVEPSAFDVDKAASQYAAQHQQTVVTGTTTVVALRSVATTLLDKRGGYLSNDLVPPGAWMDDVPNFEFGALTQVRDLAKAMRNEFSRSQTQSTEDPDLKEADPLFSTTNDRWLLPSSESQYRQAIGHLDGYLLRLSNPAKGDAQFYARADNLAEYLGVVEKRLGSLSQRLSASVGQMREDADLAGDAQARQSTPNPTPREIHTPWLQIDDVFYEARGSVWALDEFLKAMQHDFGPVLRDKNAEPSLKQIIRELDEAQQPLGSPMILNGKPYGFFANHSLVMANYVSRANAAIIDLRKLLERG